MKGFVKTAAIALAAAGLSSGAAAVPDPVAEDTAKVPQISGGTGLSFEDLRVNPMGKVPVGIESPPVRVQHAENCSPTTNSNC